MKKNKLNVNKSSLVEATILAMTGNLILEEKELVKEDVQVETSDVEVVVGQEETIIESDEATIIVQEKETEEVAEVTDVLEVPVEGDETIIPEEAIEEIPQEEVVEPVEEVPTVDEIVAEEPVVTDEPVEEVVEEPEEEIVEESVALKEELTDEEFKIEGTYWNGDGLYQEDVKLLNKLIPATGTEAAIPGVLPEKLVTDYITLSNKYYRWFNDGDVPFKKLSDGTVIYPSFTRGDKSKTLLGKRTRSSISFDLEKRVNALIEKINDQVPDWKEKLQAQDTETTEEVEEVVEEPTEVVEENVKVVTEAYSEKLGGDPEDFVTDMKAIIAHLENFDTTKLGSKLAVQIIEDFIETCNNQMNMTEAKYELKEEKELKEEAIMDDYDFKQFLAYEIKNKRPEITHKLGFESSEYETIVEDLYNKVDSEVDYILEKAINEIEFEEVKVEEEIITEAEEVCEDPECEKEELVEEKTYSEESFQKTIEGFYKEQFKTLAEFKLNNVTKTDSEIKVEGTLVNKFGKTRDICLEGKCAQKGKTFLKYNIKESAGLKLESKFANKLSMMTFTNKDNVLECKYLKQKTAKKAE